MGLKEKMDVLDFLINILREHEKSLDNLVGRFEILFQELERRSMTQKYDLVGLRMQEILNDLLGEPMRVD